VYLFLSIRANRTSTCIFEVYLSKQIPLLIAL